MKVSDLMLDMAAGDVSITDAYIQEAVGKVNVSSAVFDAAYKISVLPAAGEHLIIQEAADAGLPTDQEGACTLACESVKQELKAFYDVIVETAKKIKQNTEKDMKLVIAMGKKYGISASGTDFDEFLKELSAKICEGGKVSLPDARFLKGKYSREMTRSYGVGMANFLAAYGLSIGKVDGSLGDDIGEFKSKKDIKSFKDIEKCFSYGGKLSKFDKTVEKSRHYTDTIKVSDVQDLGEAIYTTLNIAKSIINVAGSASAKKSALTLVEGLCANECGSKKVDHTLAAINDGIKEYTDNVVSVVDNITKGFGDSVYSLTEAINGSASATA